jgi:hypothetical protein
MTYNMIKYLLFGLIHITYYLALFSVINGHGSSEIFTNPPNHIKHLMVSSLKNVKGKQLNH